MNGIMLADPYWPGTARAQAEAAARAADICFTFDGTVLATGRARAPRRRQSR